MNWIDLPSGPTGIDSALQQLLLRCGRDKRVLRSWLRGADQGRSALRNIAKRIVEEFDLNPILTGDQVDQLNSTGRTLSDEYDQGLAARALAEALDAAFGSITFGFMSQRTDQTLQTHDLVWTPAPDVRALLEGDLDALSPRASRPSSDPTQLGHVRLVPELNEAAKFVLRYSDTRTFAKNSSAFSSTVATCHPHPELNLYDPHIDLRSRNFGPVTPRSAVETIRQLVEASIEAEAQLVVLPELCLTESDLPELNEMFGEFVEADNTLRVLVGGSAHTCHEENGVITLTNQMNIWVRGRSAPITHRKLVPFTLKDVGLPAGEYLVENISPGDEVQLFPTKQSTVCFLICADLLDIEIRRSLADLGVNFIVVSSMTPVTGLFEKAFEELVGDRQAFAVLANSPMGWPNRTHAATSALFYRPTATDGSTKVEPPVKSVGYSIFDLGTIDDPTWNRLPVETP